MKVDHCPQSKLCVWEREEATRRYRSLVTKVDSKLNCHSFEIQGQFGVLDLYCFCCYGLWWYLKGCQWWQHEVGGSMAGESSDSVA